MTCIRALIKRGLSYPSLLYGPFFSLTEQLSATGASAAHLPPAHQKEKEVAALQRGAALGGSEMKAVRHPTTVAHPPPPPRPSAGGAAWWR